MNHFHPPQHLHHPTQLVLRFSPYAWAKLLLFRDLAPVEIAGFGQAAPDDPLCIEDFLTVRQRCTSVTVSMDDQAVADLFDAQVDMGRHPESFMRVWCHTHPGVSAQPSRVDEETFARVFGDCDWAVMFILAQGGQTYARLRFNTGPGGAMEIPVLVDCSRPFPASDHDAWRQEHAQAVIPEHPLQEMEFMTDPADFMSCLDRDELIRRHHHRLHDGHTQDAWEPVTSLEQEVDLDPVRP